MSVQARDPRDSFASPRLWGAAFLFALGYVFWGQLSFMLSLPMTWILPFWLPCGWLTGIFILTRFRMWIATTVFVGLAGLGYCLFSGEPFSVSLVGTAANATEAVLGAFLFLRFGASKEGLSNLRQLALLIVFAGVVAPSVGAFMGSLIHVLRHTGDTYWESWRDWWISDAMGMTVLTPFLVCWFTGKPLHWPRPKLALESGIILLLMVGASWEILVREDGILSTKILLLLPFVVWMGIRFGVRGATLAVLLLAVVVTYLASKYRVGLSPAQITTGSYLATINLFPIVASLVGLVPAFAVAERDASSARLVESVARIRGFIDNASVGIYRTTPGGRFLMANPAMVRIMGYDSFETLAAIDFESPEMQKDYPREEFRRRLESEGMLQGWSSTWIRPDGRRIYMRDTATVIRDKEGNVLYYEGVSEDVSERTAAEEALRESEERFRLLNSASGEGIVITEAGRIVEINEQLSALIGYRREEVLGRDATVLAAPEFRDVATAAIREHRSAPYQLSIVRKDGSTFPAEALPREAVIGGRLLRMTALRDLTERLRQEQRQKAMEQQMRQMQKMEALGTLAGGIAHGFNNILTGILGNLQIAEMDFGSDHPGISSIKAAEQATKRARDLVSSILSFSRSSREHRKVAPLEPTLREAVELLRAGLPSKIEIATEYDRGCPDVEFDSGQIHEAIMNLGTNSAQAMATNSGTIRISLDRVNPGRELIERHPQVTAEHTVCIRVSDNGSGIAKESLDRIFEPFYTTKGVGKGTGLGLAIVHTVMTGHNGAIVVESEVGKGTTFNLFFKPARTVEDARPEAPRLASGAGLAAFGNGRRILVVDDEESVLTVAAGILRRVGFRTSAYLQPADALASFRAAPEDYAAVVTDVSMPVMTGTELARQIRNLRPGMPIVLVSGNFKLESGGDPESVSLGSILHKPFGAGDLAKAVRDLIG